MSDEVKRTIRADVYDAVRRYPGIHGRGIEREVGVSAQLASYHLKKLVEEEFVEVHDQGGYSRYYPTSKGKAAKVTPKDQPIVGVLREEVPLHIVLVLLDHGPRSHSQLLAQVGTAKSTLSYHLAKLAQLEMVERVPGTNEIRLRERDRVYRLLLTYSPTPDLRDMFSTLWGDLYGT